MLSVECEPFLNFLVILLFRSVSISGTYPVSPPVSQSVTKPFTFSQGDCTDIMYDGHWSMVNGQWSTRLIHPGFVSFFGAGGEREGAVVG